MLRTPGAAGLHPVPVRLLLLQGGKPPLLPLLAHSSTAPQCYIKPCEEGSALQDMYRVNDGMGFQLVFTSMFIGAHSVHGALLLNKVPSDQNTTRARPLTTVVYRDSTPRPLGTSPDQSSPWWWYFWVDI